MKYDAERRCCECGGHVYRWSEPQLDREGKRYRSKLFEAIKPCEGRFQTELSIRADCFSAEAVRKKVVSKVLDLEARREGLGQTLSDALFADGHWEEIRTFFCWSTDTAWGYHRMLRNVFPNVLAMPMRAVTTEDVERAVEEKCARADYKARSIRTWLKVINRVFVYLESAYPGLVDNPVRFNGRRIREARVDEKQRIRCSRLQQGSLFDSQERRLLFAFLDDIKAGDYRGVAGVTMLESGRRPIEAGAIAPQHCACPDGENFRSAPVLETDERGGVVRKYKNGRAKRLIPISPVLSVVLDYAAAHPARDGAELQAIPYAARLSVGADGTLKTARGFSAAQISKYVHDKLAVCGIDLTVPVEDAGEDSNHNRRAYLLRYSFETDMVSFLAADRVQYALGHKRVASGGDAERKADDPGFYIAPQVQREIYRAIRARGEAVYGANIAEEVRRYLGE